MKSINFTFSAVNLIFICFDFESKFLKSWKGTILVPSLCFEFEPLEGFYFNKYEMKCVSLRLLRLMSNHMNRNTSSGWHFMVCQFFFLLYVISLLKEL